MLDERKSDRLKVEVYRQMFRLEPNRPEVNRDLALALLRAWVVSDAMPRRKKDWKLLRKICPICLAMIDAALHAGGADASAI